MEEVIWPDVGGVERLETDPASPNEWIGIDKVIVEVEDPNANKPADGTERLDGVALLIKGVVVDIHHRDAAADGLSGLDNDGIAGPVDQGVCLRIDDRIRLIVERVE